MVEHRFIARTHGAVKDAAALIAALGGDERTGKCLCPLHNDHNPSLSVTEGENGKVLVWCYVCSPTRQAALIERLRDLKLWPVRANGSLTSVQTPRRSDDERRDFALKILADTAANRGRELAPELSQYFARRGIKTVPPTMLALPVNLDPYQRVRLIADDPAMVFEVTDGQKIIGAHVTWLTPDLSDKREQEPKRQFFGPVGGGFIRLYAGELDPKQKLIIGEGVETTASVMQITGLPGIAGLSAGNLVKITPPPAAEYIVAADHDGPGLAGARALAFKLKRAGFRVRPAIPKTVGADWNDVLMKGTSDG